MLRHIKEALPSTMHLLVSSDVTLHFYRYLCTHFLVADKQFLLLIEIPIQDHTHHLKIYQVVNLPIPKGNLSACYNIETKYLGISYDETKAVEILEQQLTTCQQANGQLCTIDALLQPLANHPHASQPSMPGTQQELRKGVLCRSETHIVLPSQQP